MKKLAQQAGVSENVTKLWLMKQSIWQIYLPDSKHIPRLTLDVESPNTVHYADLLFLPQVRLTRGKKAYKYALTVVDVASRFKAFQTICKRGPLR